MFLAADIGGTKTHIAVFDGGGNSIEFLADARFPSTEYPSLEMMVMEFLDREKVSVSRAAFAVAGPVTGDRASLTNLPWIVSSTELRARLGLESVILTNDLVAIASSVPHLEADDCLVLNEGKAAPEAAIAVVAPGTGLGEAFLVWDGTRYRACPSEGGHSNFAPANELQMGLLRFLQTRFGHVSNEWVCSGQGMPNIYEFLRESRNFEEPEWLTDELRAADDPSPVIAKAAMCAERSCELCRAAMNLFVSVLGSHAGSFALSVLATGGVYLGGGIVPRILPLLGSGAFMESFTDKGRMSGLLTGVPVRAIIQPNAALIGAAHLLLEKNQGESRYNSNGAAI